MKYNLAIVAACLLQESLNGFYLSPCLSKTRKATFLASSLGGGPPTSGGNGNNKDWDDFLNLNGEESENLRRAREFMSENSLPISFHASDGEEAPQSTNSSAITMFSTEPTEDMLAKNPYIAVVSRIAPSDLISKFTSTAHPRVQSAVRQTILGLIGGLPKMAFDTTTITTGQRLASLMFQLQMTGYMFKNAEYRLSLQQSLGVTGDDYSAASLLLTGSSDDEEKADPLKGKIRGKLRVKYRSDADVSEPASEDDDTGVSIEVDAAAYMSELRQEVSKLRDELSITRKAKEDALRKDLLLYIRTLPEQELRSLTNTMSQDVLFAMKGLVNAVLAGIGEGKIGPDTVTEQTGEAMAQLCMWQLVIGYNLRTLEVREEMKKSLSAAVQSDSEGGVDLSAPGALE